MTWFLAALSLFHLVVAAGALARGVRISTAEGRAAWRSQRLRTIAWAVCWSFPLVALGCVATAWRLNASADPHLAGPLVLAPIAWLFAMGFVFAVVDIWEDGIFGNALRRADDPADPA